MGVLTCFESHADQRFYNRTTLLFERDPLLLVARQQPYWIAAGLSTMFWGAWSSRCRTIKMPMFSGFLLFTAGLAGLATVQPGESTNAIVFSGLAGLGFGGPLILVIAGVQLATPAHLMATATGVTTSARAVGASVATAIYAAALVSRMAATIGPGVSSAALEAGLPASSLAEFVPTLLAANGDNEAFSEITGATPAVIEAASEALLEAYADSIRIVYIIAAAFGVLCCIISLFLGSVRRTMTYHVDAPVENLKAKG